MPNKPRPDNPARSIRIDDGLWARVQAAATRRGTNLSEVVRAALERFVRESEESS